MIFSWSVIHFMFDFWWFLPLGVFIIALLDGVFLLVTGREHGLLDFWEDL